MQGHAYENKTLSACLWRVFWAASGGAGLLYVWRAVCLLFLRLVFWGCEACVFHSPCASVETGWASVRTCRADVGTCGGNGDCGAYGGGKWS